MFFQQKLYYFQYIYVSGWKHALRKTAYLPNQNLCWCKLSTLDESLHSPQSSLYRCQISSMRSSTRKNTPEKNAKSITPPSIGQLEKHTSSRATDVV